MKWLVKYKAYTYFHNQWEINEQSMKNKRFPVISYLIPMPCGHFTTLHIVDSDYDEWRFANTRSLFRYKKNNPPFLSKPAWQPAANSIMQPKPITTIICNSTRLWCRFLILLCFILQVAFCNCRFHSKKDR